MFFGLTKEGRETCLRKLKTKQLPQLQKPSFVRKLLQLRHPNLIRYDEFIMLKVTTCFWFLSLNYFLLEPNISNARVGGLQFGPLAARQIRLSASRKNWPLPTTLLRTELFTRSGKLINGHFQNFLEKNRITLKTFNFRTFRTEICALPIFLLLL